MSIEIVTSIVDLNGLGYAQIAEWFNFVPLVPNPEPQGVVPDAVTIPELMALTTPERMLEISAVPMYQSAIDAYRSGAVVDALAYINVLHGAKVLTDAEYKSIIAELSKTIPDPNYQAYVPGSPRYVSYGLQGPITPEQVQGWFNV